MTAPLLALHGFTQTGASWNPVIERLGGRPVTAPDLRGHGSAAALRPATLPAVMDDLDASAPNARTLAGYSMGGRIALAYALARPERFQELVLISASPGLEDEAEREARRLADEELAVRIEQDGVGAFARAWAALPLFAGQHPAVSAFAHQERLRQSPNGLAAALRGLGTGVLEPLWDKLPELRADVTLVVGDRDAKFLAIAERMSRLLPSARTIVVAHSGHAVHLEAPQAVAEVLAS